MFKYFMIIAICAVIMMNATACGLFTETTNVVKSEAVVTDMKPICEVTYDLEAMGYTVE